MKVKMINRIKAIKYRTMPVYNMDVEPNTIEPGMSWWKSIFMFIRGKL